MNDPRTARTITRSIRIPTAVPPTIVLREAAVTIRKAHIIIIPPPAVRLTIILREAEATRSIRTIPMGSTTGTARIMRMRKDGMPW